MNDDTNYLQSETFTHFSKNAVQYFPDVYTTNAGPVKSPLEVYEIIRTEDWRNHDQELLRSGILSEEQIRSHKTHYPNVIWHAAFYPCIQTENLHAFTGYALLDIDDIDEEEIESAKKLIAGLPYVQMVYRSTTFGLHAIIRVNGVDTYSDYEFMYHQLSVVFYNQFGYNLCQGACNTTQRTYLPFDPAIFYNENCISYSYKFDESSEYYYQENLKQDNKHSNIGSKKQSSEKLKKILADPDIYLDRSHYLYFKSQIEKGYSINHVVTEIDSGLPIPFTSDFKFDFKKHTLTKYFSKSFISQQEWHHVSKTIALLSEPVMSYKLFFQKDCKIYAGKRYDNLLAILCGFLFVQKIYNKPVSKSKLYSLAICLNEQCHDEHGNKFPVVEHELKAVTYFAFQHYFNDELSPKFSHRVSICNKHFINEKKNEDEPVLNVYKRLLNNIKCSYTEYRWREIKRRVLLFIKSRGLEIKSQNHFCRIVAELADINFETVKYNLSRKKYSETGGGQVNEQNKIEYSCSIIGEFTQDTPISFYDKVKSENDRLKENGIKPTARLIGENLGIYIDTAKKHLAKIRKEEKGNKGDPTIKFSSIKGVSELDFDYGRTG